MHHPEKTEFIFTEFGMVGINRVERIGHKAINKIYLFIYLRERHLKELDCHLPEVEGLRNSWGSQGL